MDEFGVLTERYGLKPQGKSMPMSQAKRSTDRRFGSDSGLNRNPTSFSSRNSSPGNGSFGSGDDFAYDFGGFGNPNTNTSNSSSGNGASVDLASVLFNSGPKSSSYVVDDLFGGMPVSQNAKNNNDDDHFGSFVSFTKQKAASSGDLLGDFSGVAAKLKSSNRRNASWDSAVGFDDLIPGFGGSSPPPVNRTSVKTTKSTLGSSEEPFFVFESDSSSEFSFSETPAADPLGEYSVLNHSGGTKPRGSSNASQPLRPPKPAQVLKADKVKSTGASLIDELEEFAMGREHNKSNGSKEAEDAKRTTRQNREEDLESFFAVNSRSTSAPKSRATTTLDPMFEQNTHNRKQKTSAGASSTAKKASPVPMTAGMDDLSFIFGATSVFGEFEEVAGESEERRRARLERHQRTQDRVARAVADMNQRDRRSENEQEERRVSSSVDALVVDNIWRIAEAMDFEIKRWAAGKEGNMRALLSSLQQVLWSECGWEPVSLTDLITSGSVKKVYRKATLCVHPDKVQQKGATLEQKYIAEKVFDILKEAWNKFNKEELS